MVVTPQGGFLLFPNRITNYVIIFYFKSIIFRVCTKRCPEPSAD